VIIFFIKINFQKDDSDHIKYLAHENFDLTNKINHLEQIIRNLNEKCSSLEESSAHCESQLEEAIKVN
jgi:predicted RNase H-like nuclease (RuvC/YqgF family)